MQAKRKTIGNVEQILLGSVAEPVEAADVRERQRQLLAKLCKSLVADAAENRVVNSPLVRNLAPRVRQTLDAMMVGDSEKQVARKLGVSRHTVHVYVKTLYRELSVSSRGELLALFIRR